MSKFQEAVAGYQSTLEKLGVAVDSALLTAVTKGLGPSIYRPDASRVSCSDPDELARLKEKFLVGKLGLADGPALDAAIKEACEKMGASNSNKQRAVMCYLLVRKFGKEGLYK